MRSCMRGARTESSRGSGSRLRRRWNGRSARSPSTDSIQAFDFSERIATDPAWTKRLVTPFEWPIPSFFTPVKQYAPEGNRSSFF